jgi:hypothetical protein
MAKILSKSGISTLQIVRPWHVTQSIDAFLGTDAYDITLSGSMTITGSVLLNGLSTTTQTNVLTYNTTTGQLFYTASSAVGGGSINTGSLGNTTISGSLTVTGSTTLIGNTTVSGSITSTGGFTGSLNGTSSWAQNIAAAGNNYEIQFNSASAFQATSSFKFNYLSQSLEQGTSVVASGNSSHAEGSSTQALGIASHAEGGITYAAGTADHAEGYQTTASSVGWPPGGGAAAAAHAEGYNTIAYGIASHAEGYATLVSNSFSHAEGYGTIANGTASHAEGFITTASGDYSHAAGYGTHATGSGVGQSVIGWFNEPLTGHGDFIIGNGTSNSSRSNLLHASGSLVNVTGNISSSGTVTMLTASIGGGIFTSASLAAGGATPTLQQVTDQGSSTTTPITASIISASNTVFGITGSFSHLQGNSPITVGDQIIFQQPVTASADISSSATLTVNRITAPGYVSTPLLTHASTPIEVNQHLSGSSTVTASFGYGSFGDINTDRTSSAAYFSGNGSTLTNLQRPITSSAVNFSASADNGGYYFRSGGNITCSIQTNANVAINTGTEFEFFQTSSAGNLLFETGSASITLNSKSGNMKLAGQFSGATLKKVGTDEWDLIGDLG